MNGLSMNTEEISRDEPEPSRKVHERDELSQGSVQDVNSPAGGGRIPAGGNDTEEAANNLCRQCLICCWVESECTEEMREQGQGGKNRRKEKCLSFLTCGNSLHNFDSDLCQLYVCQILPSSFQLVINHLTIT